jgi:hypothetical protein
VGPPCRVGDDVGDGRQGVRLEHGAPDGLEYPEGDERAEVRRHRTRERADGENDQAGLEHLSPANPVSD